MRRSRSGCSSLMLMVVLASIAFGVVLTFNQMNPPSALIAAAAPVTVTDSTTLASVLPAATPETPKYALHIPLLGLTAPIIHIFVDGETWNVENLGANVGHLTGTAWFDDAAAGNIALVGHVELRDGTLGIFADLNTLPIGETITVHGGDYIRRYRIESSYETEASNLRPLQPSPEHLITLITCSGYDFLSNTYLRRHIIIARMIGADE